MSPTRIACLHRLKRSRLRGGCFDGPAAAALREQLPCPPTRRGASRSSASSASFVRVGATPGRC